MLRQIILTAALLLSLLALVACEGDSDDESSYLTEIVPACAPIEGMAVDPCEPSAPVESFGPTGTLSGGSSTVTSGHPPFSIDRLLQGESILDVTHIVARGTFAPGSVRCTIGNIGEDPAYFRDDFDGVQYIKCFADLQVREYILGTGPDRLSVEVHHIYYTPANLVRGYDRAVEDDTPTALEEAEWYRRGVERNVRSTDGLFSREMIHFLSTSHDINMVAFKIWRQTSWGLERATDGTIAAIHPERAFRGTARYQQYRSSLEVPLETFKTQVRNADQARQTANGGRIVPADDDGIGTGGYCAQSDTGRQSVGATLQNPGRV